MHSSGDNNDELNRGNEVGHDFTAEFDQQGLEGDAQQFIPQHEHIQESRVESSNTSCKKAKEGGVIIDPMPLKTAATACVAKVRLNKNRTVSARLQRLEESHTRVIEGLAEIKDLRARIENQEIDEKMLTKIARRLRAIESVLSGFDEVDSAFISPIKKQNLQSTEGDSVSGLEQTTEIDAVLELNYLTNDEQSEYQKDGTCGKNSDISTSTDNSRSFGVVKSIVQQDNKVENDYDVNCEVLPIRSGSIGEVQTSGLVAVPEDRRKIDKEVDADDKGNAKDVPSIPRHRNRSGSVLLRLNERETRTEELLKDLAHQISVIRDDLNAQTNNTAISDIDVAENSYSEHLEKRDVKVTESLQSQINDLTTCINEKVSNQDFEAEKEVIRKIIDNSGNTCETEGAEGNNAKAIQNELWTLKGRVNEQIEQIKDTKLDRDVFEQQLDQLENTIKLSLDKELDKQQALMSNGAEKINSDLAEFRAALATHKNDIISRMDTGLPPTSGTELLEMDELDARIQQATDAVRVSLEEELSTRLEELKSIEKEMGGFASKLADKPSQDQIDSMLRELEHTMSDRLGEDKTLRLIIENMRIGKSLLQQFANGWLERHSFLIKSHFHVHWPTNRNETTNDKRRGNGIGEACIQRS